MATNGILTHSVSQQLHSFMSPQVCTPPMTEDEPPSEVEDDGQQWWGSSGSEPLLDQEPQLVLLQLNFRDQECAYALLDGTILFVSPVCAELFGDDASHVLGRNLGSYLLEDGNHPVVFPLHSCKPLLSRTVSGYLVWIQPVRIRATEDVLLFSRHVLCDQVSFSASILVCGWNAVLNSTSDDIAEVAGEPSFEHSDGFHDEELLVEEMMRVNKRLLLPELVIV